MTIRPLAFHALLLLTACGGNALPQASSARPAASEATPADAKGGSNERDDLKTELVKVDTRLKELAKEVEAARDDAKTDLKRQLDALQKGDDELKARLRTTEASAGADADKARQEIHGAIVDLKRRLQGVADRIQR